MSGSPEVQGYLSDSNVDYKHKFGITVMQVISDIYFVSVGSVLSKNL